MDSGDMGQYLSNDSHYAPTPAVYCVSDLHVDFEDNFTLLQKQCTEQDHHNDVLILAGDISHDLEKIRKTLAVVSPAFKAVFAVPGNHDLWVERDKKNGEQSQLPADSKAKLQSFIDVCKSYGVHTAPQLIDGSLLVFPLFSWYDEDLCDSDDRQRFSNKVVDVWSDFHMVKWPLPDSAQSPEGGIEARARMLFERTRAINEILLSMNNVYINHLTSPQTPSSSFQFPCRDQLAPGTTIITCSHFLPRRELLPPATWLVNAQLPRVMGSHALEAQVRAVNPRIHVFGHSHIDRDVELDGVRYVQYALKYPSERRMFEKFSFGEKAVFKRIL